MKRRICVFHLTALLLLSFFSASVVFAVDYPDANGIYAAAGGKFIRAHAENLVGC